MLKISVNEAEKTITARNSIGRVEWVYKIASVGTIGDNLAKYLRASYACFSPRGSARLVMVKNETNGNRTSPTVVILAANGREIARGQINHTGSIFPHNNPKARAEEEAQDDRDWYANYCLYAD